MHPGCFRVSSNDAWCKTSFSDHEAVQSAALGTIEVRTVKMHLR